VANREGFVAIKPVEKETVSRYAYQSIPRAIAVAARIDRRRFKVIQCLDVGKELQTLVDKKLEGPEQLEEKFSLFRR
jgi:hypothetical protein